MSDPTLPSPITDHSIPSAPPAAATPPPPMPGQMLQQPMGGAVRGKALDTSRGYVGLGPRFMAGLIDMLILLIPNFIVSAITAGLGSIVLVWLYFALMHSSERQATFGQQAMGIVITDMSGNRISFGQATGQYFASLISSLILLIGYIMIAFTAKKQGLHDMMAGTLHYYRAN